MNNRLKISIDGVETRRLIGEMAGRMDGIAKVCREYNLPSEPINMACLKGYANPSVITKYMKAGIPIVLSSEPIPSRRKDRHARRPPNDTEVKEAERTPVQLKIDDFNDTDKFEAIRDLLIVKLTEIVEELKNI